jgi:hypothetical protein
VGRLVKFRPRSHQYRPRLFYTPRIVTLTIIVVAVVSMLVVGLPPRSVTGALFFFDRDCRDFHTEREAQAFFEAAGPGDLHGLDADHDGRACEALP